MASVSRRRPAPVAPGCAWTDFGNGAGLLHWTAGAPPVGAGTLPGDGWRVVAQATSRNGRQGVWMLRWQADGADRH
ncbi:MAG: hypothetical protein LCH70_01855 [Proteobacteria bacterium]|nr:hypothetical protein [Pseudomonadota bacterium]